MKTLSEAFGFNNVVTLDDSNQIYGDIGMEDGRVSVKNSGIPNLIPMSELEAAYLRHPLVFGGINKMTQVIMSAGWNMKVKEERPRMIFQTFIDNIGYHGDDVTFDTILETVFKYQFIYGNAFLELIHGENTDDPNNVVDLGIIDPKSMTYAKLSSGQIALDEYDKPIGYMQKYSYIIDSTNKRGDEIPMKPGTGQKYDIDVSDNEIFIAAERIVHFKLYPYGDRFYSQGVIEPAFKSIMSEMTIKNSHTTALENKGDAPIVDYVGDLNHPPTPQQIDNALRNLQRMKSNKFLAFPYWHRVEPLNVKTNPDTDRTLTYLRSDITSAMNGFPLSLITGMGEATNRATLNIQLMFLTYSLNDLVTRTLSMFNKYVFRRIAKFHSLKETPEIYWGYIGVEEISDKAKRINEYVKSGAILPEQARGYAISSERLDVTEDDKTKDTTQDFLKKEKVEEKEKEKAEETKTDEVKDGKTQDGDKSGVPKKS